MQRDVCGAPIKSAIWSENTIISDEKIKPITRNTINDISNIFFASLNLPLALHLDTRIDKATGNPAVDITYKYAYISYAEL